MSLTEDRILVSIEFNLIANTINILWRDRILKDGEEISGNNHRGAYPVNEQGEVDEDVKTLLGASLQDILGEAAVGAQRRVDELQAKNETLNLALIAVVEERDMINSNRQMLVNHVDQLQEYIRSLEVGLASENKE